jgi:hypothetical protein
MRNYDVWKERIEMRRYERYLAGLRLPPGQALDQADADALLTYQGDQVRANLFKRAQLIRESTAAGRGSADLAEQLGIPREAISGALATPRLAAPSIATEIEARVVARWPETPEPGRAVAPTGERAIPGMTYPLDPRLFP